MKFIITILLFLITHISFSQQSLTEKTIAIVCDCFEKAPETSNVDFNLIETCFDFSDKKYQDLLEEEIKKEIDTLDTSLNYDKGYEKGYQLAKEMFGNIQEPLVNECDRYFDFIEKTKIEMIVNIGKGINKKKADSLKCLFKKEDWEPNDMWAIGAYYLYKGKLKKAKKNFEKCLSKDSENGPSIFFLAMTHELQGDYESAIIGYNTINGLPQNASKMMTTMYLEAVKRKQKEARK